MKYNFDEIIDRTNTNSIKYDFKTERGMPDDVIPLWVADMDFKTAPPITDALIKAVNHAIFGYTETKKNGDYFIAVHNWFNNRFGFDVKPQWLIKTPGVIFTLNMAVKAFTDKNDAIIIQIPVYPPFKSSVEVNGRRCITNPLIYIDGRYQIDFDDFERKIIENNVKMFILCNPHNPIGRVWTLNELTQLGDICLKHNVLVISDEIHCDFVFGKHKHTVFGTINERFLYNSVICTAPSKTFNLAGLKLANVFIADDNLNRKFKQKSIESGYSHPNSMAIVACQAAYEHGSDWLDELLIYLDNNYKYIDNFVRNNLPKVRLIELEGTYLIWLDLNEYGFSEAELNHIIIEKAKLWVNNGTMFGEGGHGFIRINIACPLELLKKAFMQLAATLL